MDECAAEPLYEMLRKMRRPVTLRGIMASCLRHVRMGDPLTGDSTVVPTHPVELIDNVSVEETSVSNIRCQIYSPKRPAAGILIYMHGGGFVVGASEDTDYITRQLCYANDLVVVSVNYRLAPESMFPDALNDCLKVFSWAIENRSSLGCQSAHVFLAGDSAGGNLAAALAMRLRQNKMPVAGVILLAPWLDMQVESYESFNKLAPTGVVYDAAFIGFARASYLNFEDWTNPLASPVLCDPKQMPPTLAIVGTADPLLDQSMRFYNQSVENDHTHIELAVYQGMPHCFYSFPNLFAEEKHCYKRISKFVKKQLTQTS